MTFSACPSLVGFAKFQNGQNMNNSDSRTDRIDRILAELRAMQTQDHAYTGAADAPDLCDEDIADEDNVLKVLFTDLADTVGPDFLDQVPPALLEQFCMMSLARNEATGLLLRNLIIGFMKAYTNHETSDQAVQALLVLEHLGDIRQATIN